MAPAPSLSWLFVVVGPLVSGRTALPRAEFARRALRDGEAWREARETWPARRVSAEYPATMRRLLCLIILAPLSACLQLGTPGDSGSGAASAGSSSAGSSATDAGTTVVSGTNCGVDPGSGVALCLGITSCPTVLVDPDQFPGCGYRISGSVIDLECLCNDSICPMGSAASCADAKALLMDQSAQGVCAGIAAGLCTLVNQAASDTNGNSSSSCDKNCRADCAGDPACITLCGC